MPTDYLIKTYKSGPSYKYKDGDLTIRKILKIIQKMNILMPNYIFELEPISQGGIRVIYPDPQTAFKTFRLGFKNWPFINGDGTVKPEELDKPLVTRYEPKHHLQTFLKAFRDAPAWTKEEILCVDDIFHEEGLVRVGRWRPRR